MMKLQKNGANHSTGEVQAMVTSKTFHVSTYHFWCLMCRRNGSLCAKEEGFVFFGLC